MQYLQQVSDQLYGILMDFLPRMRRIHEGGVLDLFVDILVLIERECSRERDVDDDPSAPHVEGPVVSLVTEHLGSKVGRSAHYGLSERFLSNNSGEAKVAEFNL